MYFFYLNFFFPNYMSILKKIRKNIFKITFMLISINKKVSLRNQTFLSLFWTKKPVITILLIIRVKPSIFRVFISVFQMIRPSFAM